MFRRRKGFSASQSKATSRRMRNAMYGTHNEYVPRRRSAGSLRENASDVRFSSARKTRRAEHGLVSQVTPHTSSRETVRDYSRRVNHRAFDKQVQHTANIRRFIVIAIVAVLAIAAAVGAAYAAYLGSVSSRLALKDSSASSVLVTQPSEGGYWCLVAADLTASDVEEPEGMFVLACVNEQAGSVTMLALPGTSRVKLSDGEYHTLAHVLHDDGIAALVSAVTTLTQTDISHVVYSTSSQLSSLVDYLGGLQVTVSKEVDDPAAGSDFISAGTQTLSGSAALTFLRASNFSDGVQDQASNHVEFARALIERLVQADFWGCVRQVDQTADYLSTDWDAAGLISVEGKLHDASSLSVTGCVADGYTSSGDNAVYVVDAEELTSALALVKEGNLPESSDDEDVDVDPSSFTITVRNGSGITGGASQIATILTNAGYRVESTGNAESYVYTETLVIYLDDAYEPACRAVAKTLGSGRVLDGSSYYSFDTNVLVVLGADWKPLN